MPPECHDAYQLYEALDAGVTLGLDEFLGLPAMLGDDLRMIYGAANNLQQKAESDRETARFRALAGLVRRR